MFLVGGLDAEAAGSGRKDGWGQVRRGPNEFIRGRTLETELIVGQCGKVIGAPFIERHDVGLRAGARVDRAIILLAGRAHLDPVSGELFDGAAIFVELRSIPAERDIESHGNVAGKIKCCECQSQATLPFVSCIHVSLLRCSRLQMMAAYMK